MVLGNPIHAKTESCPLSPTASLLFNQLKMRLAEIVFKSGRFGGVLTSCSQPRMKAPLPDPQFITPLPANQNRFFGFFRSLAPSLSNAQDLFRQTCLTPRNIRKKHEPAIQAAAPVERTFQLTK